MENHRIVKIKYFIRLTCGSISQEKPINIGAPLR